MKKIISLICCILVISLVLCSCNAVNVMKTQEFELQKETDHFLIYSPAQEASAAEEISQGLEDSYKKTNRNFNVTLSDKIEVTIYPSIEKFKQSIKEEDAPDWLAATDYKHTIKMISTNNSEYTYNKQNISIQAKISVISIMLNKINKKTPEYLQNGITRYETDLSYQVSEQVMQALKNNTFPTIKQLEDICKTGKSGSLISYTLIDYILDQYGYAKLTQFVKTPKIKSVFGISTKEFEQDWLQYVKNIYDTQFDYQKETQHFIFHYMEQDVAATEQIAQGMEENYKRITTDLQTEPATKVNVIIYPDIKLFKKVVKSDGILEPKISGYITNDNNIKMVSPSDQSFNNLGSMIPLAVHEFTHVVVRTLHDNISTPIPRYLNEGIACYEAGQQEAVAITIIPLLRQSTFPTLAQIRQIQADAGLYQFGYVFVQYIVEIYGYDKLIEYVKTPDIQAVFEIPENEFEKNWTDFLEHKYVR